MIQIEGVSYRYPGGATPALSEAGLEAGPGGLVLVAGESASGKSTLLRCINGLVPHFHGGRFTGRVCVDGIQTILCRPRDLASRVGFVGQDPEDHAVVDRVEEDIAFSLENLGVEPVKMRKRVEEVLDAVGIESLRRRRLDSLSGGERQRVAIAGALASMPGYLVLDEVTSQLDPQSAEEVLSALLRLRDEIGIAVILAEHRLERVLQYADRLCLVEQGRVRSGVPASLLKQSGLGSPVVKLGRAMGWDPLPLGLRDARLLLEKEAAPSHLAEAALRRSSASGAPVLEGRGVSVNLGGRRALNKVDLEASPGEVIALMGRNGSGKTTLLRALAGLIKHGGRIRRPEPVALVPQNPQRMLFRTTVAEEIAATLRSRGEADGGRLASEAERFGLEHLLGRHPRDLSGGQKTRVAIAAALAGRPTTVLMDEPTRGMDESGKEFLERLTGRLADEGAVVLMATHDVELAARIASRVIILSRGEVVVDSAPSEALASSVTFSTQMNKVFGSPAVLTLEDALQALGREPAASGETGR